MDLNKLPKDMLIKLICTIQKDTEEKCFSQSFVHPHLCGCCYRYYHPNYQWWCILYDGKHSRLTCNKCYSTFSDEGKKRYVKCEHYKEN